MKRKTLWGLFLFLLVIVFFVLFPLGYKYLFIQDIRESINKSKNDYADKAKIFPKIDQKLSLFSSGKIELSKEEYQLLNDIWFEETDMDISDWFLLQIKKEREGNTLYYQRFSKDNPNITKCIESWIANENNTDTEKIIKFIDEYYGYIPCDTTAIKD